MTNDTQPYMHKVIRRNIINHGHHMTSVLGGESPGYLYTIGLKERVGGELVIAGLSNLGIPLAGHLANEFSARLRDGEAADKIVYEVETVGSFKLTPAHTSWTGRLMLGVKDFYKTKKVVAWQIVPSNQKPHIDTPDLSQPFDVQREPVWQWLDGGWPYRVSPDSAVATDVPALQGRPIIQLIRHSEEEWEMLAEPRPNLTVEDIRVISLATMVGHDPSLAGALNIKIGMGLYRNTDKKGSPGPWLTWHPEPLYDD